MISRRLLRIKVMQGLYALEFNPDVPVSNINATLTQSVKDTYKLYLCMLHSIREVANYVWDYKKMIDGKYIKSEEEIKVTSNIAETTFIKQLNNNSTLKKLFEKDKIASYIEKDTIKNLFYELKKEKEFKDFSQDPHNINHEKKLFRILFKKVILKSDLFISQLEEYFPTWPDDTNSVINMTMATINEFYKLDPPEIEKCLSPVKWDEISKFASDLFLKCINNQEELKDLVVPVLNNWAADRTNKLDMIIIKMALIELLYFPNVPVKVSINEYIEISKQYSTPKSKEFINGVLDTLLKKLKRQNKINKTGRGLVE